MIVLRVVCFADRTPLLHDATLCRHLGIVLGEAGAANAQVEHPKVTILGGLGNCYCLRRLLIEERRRANVASQPILRVEHAANITWLLPRLHLAELSAIGIVEQLF